MADSDARKERFQGNTFENNEDAALYERYLKMKRERDTDKSRDARDRVNLEDAVDIVGTCDMMCPEFESLQRYFERDVDPFEKPPTGGYNRSLMVQTFARAAAGNDLPPPEDIRPPPILRATVDYLLDKILVDHGIEATHNFIWNRTRAVRSDLTRQRDHSPDAIYCLERIVRYHILALHVVCRGDRDKETLEIEQLKKALQSLIEVYNDARAAYSSHHEPEFRSYYILMHIRSRHAPFTLRKVPISVYNSPILQWALGIRFTLARNTDGADEHNSDVTQMDYAGFFALLSHSSTSYLTACLLEAHFDDIRRQICLMLGLTLKNTARSISLPDFQRQLHLDNTEDAMAWLSHLKWNVNPQGRVEVPQSRRADNLLPSIATAHPYPRTKSLLVQAKRNGPTRSESAASLDSLITRGDRLTHGVGYLFPTDLPRRRRQLLQASVLPTFTQRPPPPTKTDETGTHFTIPGTSSVSSSTAPQGPSPRPLFNPFGPRQNSPSMPLSTPMFPPPSTAPTSAFSAFARPAIPTHSSPPVTLAPQPATPLAVESLPSSTSPAPPQFSAWLEPQPMSNTVPSIPIHTTPAVAVDQTPSITTGVAFGLKEERSARDADIVLEETSSPHGPADALLADHSDEVSFDTEPLARPLGYKRSFSDGDSSATSSVLPASTRGDAPGTPPLESKDLHMAEVDAQFSSDTDAGVNALTSSRTHQLQTQALEHDRLATLRNSVQQWRESVKSKERSLELSARRQMAEETAQTLSLGARFANPPSQTVSPSKRTKRNVKDVDTTQDFVLAEKTEQDRKRISTAGTFARLIKQAGIRRTAEQTLPEGWQTWVSFVPGSDPISRWLKAKLTGKEDSPDLANITLGPAITTDGIAAPGLLILHIDHTGWDSSLRRAKELLELLPADSPYLPGFLIIRTGPISKETAFPSTWVSKLDRMLQGLVMDRGAVVFTDFTSSEAIEAEFSSQLRRLRFDVEGLAQGLDLADVVGEYISWWNVQFQYGKEQALQPNVDLTRMSLVLTALMSALDELLRQIMLLFQVSDTGVPFNNFQSKHNIGAASQELLDYLSKLGGDIHQFPSTPAAIMQQPIILFDVLLQISARLEKLLLLQNESFRTRTILRRPALERLGREFNDILEKELAPIDRSMEIYSAEPIRPPNVLRSNLKRKRSSNTTLSTIPQPVNSSTVLQSRNASATLHLVPQKRSKMEVERLLSAIPSKAAFKVQVAKARLELLILQKMDSMDFAREDDRISAKARAVTEVATATLEQTLQTTIGEEKIILETQAALELIDEADGSIFMSFSKNQEFIKVLMQLQRSPPYWLLHNSLGILNHITRRMEVSDIHLS